MLSARKEAGKFTEGVILSKSMEVLFRAVPPSLYLALAQTEPEEKAERYQLMQQYGISELDAAFKVAEKIDRPAASSRRPWTCRNPENAMEQKRPSIPMQVQAFRRRRWRPAGPGHWPLRWSRCC
jgi:hypothetical protein